MKRLLPLSLSLVLCACLLLACAQSSDASPKQVSSGAAAKQASSGQPSADATPKQSAVSAPIRVSPLADSLLKTFHVEPCCAGSLDKCAKQKSDCAIAQRLTSFIYWMDSVKAANNNVTDEKFIETLHERYNVFRNRQKQAADTAWWPAVGDPGAPLTVVMYFSGTCPTCKHNFRDLSWAVARGPLKGKAKIVAKPLNANFSNKAITAAHEMGRFTDFMLALADADGRVDTNTVYDIAGKLQMDVNKFKLMTESSLPIQQRAEQSGKEADKNGVTHVPTYFISGYRYNSVLSPRWIADAIEYFYETEFQKK